MREEKKPSQVESRDTRQQQSDGTEQNNSG